MKKTLVFASSFMALAIMLAMSTAANAAPLATAPGQNKLQCFDGTTDGFGFGGICKLTGNGAKGPATLDNTDSNPNGDYAGVFINNTTMSGQLVGDVKQLSYTYTGITVPTLGDLSLNVGIDTSGDGLFDTFLFIDAANCPGVGGAVDVIHNAVCGIVVGSPETAFYPNWAALVAAHPEYQIATDQLPFIIAERVPAEPSAFWTVADVKLGKGGK
jgi:hypothetical protein